MDDEHRRCEPILIGDLLKEILDELKTANARSLELEKRMARLEGRDEILSIGESAEYIGRTRQTVSRYLNRGLLHMVEGVGKKGIRLSELNRIREI